MRFARKKYLVHPLEAKVLDHELIETRPRIKRSPNKDFEKIGD